ncbi:MAG: hypothetical protein QG608_1202, partial [Actinomycetota bacterium]|nr:hypothetical protein [Actinomycetota bacterium]
MVLQWSPGQDRGQTEHSPDHDAHDDHTTQVCLFGGRVGQPVGRAQVQAHGPRLPGSLRGLRRLLRGLRRGDGSLLSCDVNDLCAFFVLPRAVFPGSWFFRLRHRFGL